MLPTLGQAAGRISEVDRVIRERERTLLVAAGPDDEDDYLAAAIASRDHLRPWIDAPDTPARYAEVLARAEQPEYHPLLVRVREGYGLAGVINISNIVRGAFQSAFVGYWAFAGFGGRGYLTDGLLSVIDHAFTDLALHRLEANIQPANTASISLAERCGFRYEGFSPSYLQVFGEWRDHNRYAITVEDRAGASGR
jgi:[ribosomal protein S5]-alanine N-acetyltransferase